MPVINIGGGRQTGRTTTMLVEALRASKEARHKGDVVVVAHCHAAAKALREHAAAVLNGAPCAPRPGAFEVVDGGVSVIFTSPDARDEALGGRNVFAEFWDHHAVERVHEERLRFQDELVRLRNDLAIRIDQLKESRAEALTLRLEMDDLKKDLARLRAAE